MALLACNLTSSAVTLAAGKSTVVLPAKGANLTYGAPVDVTSELKGLTDTQYTALESQRAGVVAYVWTSVPEYVVGTGTILTVGALQSLSILSVASTTATVTAIAESRHACIYHPLAVTTVSVIAAALPANGVGMTIIPNTIDHARKLQVTVATGSGAGSILTLVGIGANGQAVTETQDISTTKAGQTTVTTYAYRSLTSATPTVNSAAGTVGVGVAAALSLPTNGTPLALTTLSVIGETDDGVNVAVGTVDTTAQTVIPTTTVGPSHVYEFDYTFSITPTQAAHTHSLA
jgi:hypothetical protein